MIETEDISTEGPIRHPNFPLTLENQILVSRHVFFEVLPMSIEETLHNFRRDTHPESEVELWEGMAAVYLSFLPIASSPKEKASLFAALLSASTGRREEAVAELADFSDDQTQAIMKMVDRHIVARPLFLSPDQADGPPPSEE